MQPRELQQKRSLAAVLREHLDDLPGTQAMKAESLGVSQPRLNDLLRDRIEKFSLDSLVSLVERAGLKANVSAQSVLLPPATGPRFRNLSGDSPFPVDPSELDRLDSDAAARLFLRLLRCEAFRIGLSPKDVVLSLRTSVSDGGIDAKVLGSSSAGGLLSAGDTYFQIKTGGTFKPWQPSKLREELFGASRTRPAKSALGPAIKDCLDQGGTYCLAVFGHDLLPTEHSKAVNELTKLLQSCGYKTPKVDVVGQGQIAGEVERYPSIYLDLFGFEEDYFLSIRAWGEQKLMQTPLELGEKQEALISDIREILTSNSASHIRLVGEPGIGKTRLILEALSTEELAPITVYVPTGEEFQRSRLFKEINRSERTYPLILVVDDCSDDDRASIWSVLCNCPMIKLITIDHGYQRGTDSSIKVLECPRLDTDKVEAILTSYLGPGNYDAGKWAEVCDGSPRVAHAVGENLRENPDDILRPPATVPLWDRFISGFERIDSTTAEEYRVVLRHIALFDRFGFESPVSDEGKFISDLVQEAHPSITYPKYQSIVQHFRGRRVLQGRHTLFLVPKALHFYLWVDFWNHYGRGFQFEDFYSRLPSSMRDWFLRLFTSAHESPQALAVVREITGSDGPFADTSFATGEVGPRLLRYLAEADRKATLACIERVFRDWDHSRFRSWTTGRQDIVWALEKIAVWDDTFPRAAKLLAKMALAENATNSNNSKGTLLDLFCVGLGWAPTQAPPDARLPILRESLDSKDSARRRLGLEMAGSWLSTYGGSRVVGAEYQGLRPTLEFWRPKTYGEVFDAWRAVWRLLDEMLEDPDAAWQQSVAETLTQAAEGLLRFDAVAAEVIDTLFKIAGIKRLSKKSLVALVIRTLRIRGDDLPDETLSRIQELDEVLTGATLWERITRFVLNSSWDEDLIEVEGEVVESEEPKTRVEQLADELMTSENHFAPYAEKLLTTSGHRLPHLGISCGRLALNASWDFLILKLVTQSSGDLNSEFIGGFLAGVRETSEDRWEKVILDLLDDATYRNLATECIYRSGCSDVILERMRQLHLEDAIPATAFSNLAYQLRGNKISEAQLLSVVDALLTKGESQSGPVAVELMHAYYRDKENPSALPNEVTLRSLIAATNEPDDRNQMAAYHWGKLATDFVNQYPSDAMTILEAHLSSGGLMSLHNRNEANIAESIVKVNPIDSWQVISRLLESEDVRRYDLMYWLSGSLDDHKPGKRSPATYLPAEAVIAWAKQDPDSRVVRVQQLLPKTVDPDDGGILTVRFIEEFCDQKDAAGGLVGHFWSGSWSGPESLHMEEKRTLARKWLADTTSPAVDAWLSEYIEYLSAAIESAKIREEREF